MHAEPRSDAAPHGHPGVRAGADRRQRHQDSPAGLQRLQRRLRRRPDGRAPAAVGRGAGRGARPDALDAQHLLAGIGQPDHRRRRRTSCWAFTTSTVAHKGETGEPRGAARNWRSATCHEALLALRPQADRHAHADQGPRRSATDVVTQRLRSPKTPIPANKVAHHDGRPAASSTTSCPWACRSTTLPLSAKGGSRVIADCYQLLGRPATIELLDNMKELGFKNSHAGGPVVRHHRPAHPGQEAGDHRRPAEEGRPHREEPTDRAPSPSRNVTAQLIDIWAPRPQAGHRRADGRTARTTRAMTAARRCRPTIPRASRT